MKLLPNSFSQWQSFYWSNQDVLQNTPGKDVIKQLTGDKTNYKIAKSDFFSCILLSCQKKGWVDIENEYYRLLFPSEDKGPFFYRDKPKELNEELAYVRSLLIEYLKSVQISENITKQDIKDKLYAPIRYDDISIGAKLQWHAFVKDRFEFDSEIRWDGFSEWDEILKAYGVKEIKEKKEEIKSFVQSNRDQVDYMGIDSIVKNNYPNGFLFPDRVMLLNFNYTTTADFYLIPNERFTVNHIHGRLTEPGSVIFGYGDEMDENYKKFSNKNDNEYLTNIKSIRYLESPNYRNLLEFIESDTYQIYIMGHSCGNSDRTLLNTLFEHRNCVSIKPFYHKRDDGSDNYMELVQNISRNFTDMKLMRDRVVNKSFCETF